MLELGVVQARVHDKEEDGRSCKTEGQRDGQVRVRMTCRGPSPQYPIDTRARFQRTQPSSFSSLLLPPPPPPPPTSLKIQFFVGNLFFFPPCSLHCLPLSSIPLPPIAPFPHALSELSLPPHPRRAPGVHTPPWCTAGKAPQADFARKCSRHSGGENDSCCGACQILACQTQSSCPTSVAPFPPNPSATTTHRFMQNGHVQTLLLKSTEL